MKKHRSKIRSFLATMIGRIPTVPKEWRGKRYRPCTCGRCGLIWDTRYDVSIAWFTGPNDDVQPLAEDARQHYMAETCRVLNAWEAAGTRKPGTPPFPASPAKGESNV